jgi:hypothetical protein
VTHRAAAYHPLIRRPPLSALLLAATLPLAACGGQKSTLPPSPGSAGTVGLRNLARYPEVYADATIATTGTVARVGGGGAPLFKLEGARGARIVLEPSASAAPFNGQRVRVSGIFTVTFKLGYEILISRIGRAGSL